MTQRALTRSARMSEDRLSRLLNGHTIMRFEDLAGIDLALEEVWDLDWGDDTPW